MVTSYGMTSYTVASLQRCRGIAQMTVFAIRANRGPKSLSFNGICFLNNSITLHLIRLRAHSEQANSFFGNLASIALSESSASLQLIM